jgi:capsular polysaccharide biosynthesis protein
VRPEAPPLGFAETHAATDEDIDLFDLLTLFRQHLVLLVSGSLAAGLVALGITYLIAPTFTAVTTFLPPQQQQSAAAALLTQLGPLAGIAGASGSIRTPADQYVALMQSASVSDHLVDHFQLMEIYKAKFRMDARAILSKNVRISVGKKDGLITVEVDDTSSQRAAEMANHYVDELRRMTGTIAITEAQQAHHRTDRT